MEHESIRFGTSNFVQTSQPGNNRFFKLYTYRINGPSGTHGIVKTSTVNPKSYNVSASVMSGGPSTFKFKIPRIKPDPRAKFIPRSGGVMRVIGSQKGDDPLSFVNYDPGEGNDSIIKGRDRLAGSIFGAGQNFNSVEDYSPLFNAQNLAPATFNYDRRNIPGITTELDNFSLNSRRTSSLPPGTPMSIDSIVPSPAPPRRVARRGRAVSLDSQVQFPDRSRTRIV